MTGSLSSCCLICLLCRVSQSFWSKLWFWREVVDDIPLSPENYRILNPDIIHKTGQVLQKYALKQGHVSSQMPTLVPLYISHDVIEEHKPLVQEAKIKHFISVEILQSALCF